MSLDRESWNISSCIRMQLTYNLFFLVAYFCFLYYGQTDTPYKMCISRSRKLHLSLPVFISTYKSTYLCVCLSIRKVTFISSYSHMQISYKYTFLCLCLSNENVAFMSSCIPMQLTYNLFFWFASFSFLPYKQTNTPFYVYVSRSRKLHLSLVVILSN